MLLSQPHPMHRASACETLHLLPCGFIAGPIFKGREVPALNMRLQTGL